MEARPIALTSRQGERIAFRSTLEARWASYFDTLGLAWIYEPFRFKLKEGFTYTPDFEVPEIGIIEVKPTAGLLKESAKRIGLFLSQSVHDRVYLFSGGSPFHAVISMLHGNPVRVVNTSHIQRNIILGGSSRQDLARRDYSMFCDSINIALKSASGRIVTDVLTAGEKMVLRDTR